MGKTCVESVLMCGYFLRTNFHRRSLFAQLFSRLPASGNVIRELLAGFQPTNPQRNFGFERSFSGTYTHSPHYLLLLLYNYNKKEDTT